MALGLWNHVSIELTFEKIYGEVQSLSCFSFQGVNICLSGRPARGTMSSKTPKSEKSSNKPATPMSSASAEPNTPAKAGIKRTLEFPSPSPLKSPTSSTKEPIYGYVLYVTELLKGAYGQYFHVQFQTNAGTFSINAYETI